MPKQNINMMMITAYYKTDKNTSNSPTIVVPNTSEVHNKDDDDDDDDDSGTKDSDSHKIVELDPFFVTA
jgi:hypothetical protein